MRFTLFTFVLLTVLFTSCSVECDKTLKGTIIDAMTEEALPQLPVKVEARKVSRNGIGASFKEYTTSTDELGNFEITTDWDFTAWDRVRVLEDGYYMKESEYGFDQLEVCGENHIQITMHKLAYVQLNFYDDPDKNITQSNVFTEYRAENGDTRGFINESLIIPVLEEIPNDIYFNQSNDLEGHLYRDTLTIEVPRGDTLVFDIGL